MDIEHPSQLGGEPKSWQEYYHWMMAGCQAMPGGNPAKLHEALRRMYTGEVDFNEMTGPTGIGRAISVPLQKLDTCAVCAKTTELRLCSSCASAIYCSKECQRLDWKKHKLSCSQTHQINLKIFHPFIAYLFDFLRRIATRQEPEFPKDLDPYVLHIFERLGYRKAHNPSENLPHPALRYKIVKAPSPGARRATNSEKTFHHTVVLGAPFHLKASRIPDPTKMGEWYRGQSLPGAMKLYLQIIRESYILEITVAIALILLSEIYSTRLTREPPEPGKVGPGVTNWQPRMCFRLEHGHSPVSDFGICKGRIQGKVNRVQTWAYYDPKNNTRITALDPDNHYWLYFRTISGEEVTLDCCSYSYGMHACVDASETIRNLPGLFRDYGSSRTPANFRSPQDQDRQQPYTLIEEKRFSVMQNTSLHQALGWEAFGGRKEDQHTIVREFMNLLNGKSVALEQEERVREYRALGASLLDQILSGKYWKDWGKPVVHRRDDTLDEGKVKADEFLRGSIDDTTCEGKLTGLMGLFQEAMGIK